MRLEYRLPLVSNEGWKPLSSMKEAVRLSSYADIQLRDAETHEAVKLGAPYGFNEGTRCDVSDGPCACGAWH